MKIKICNLQNKNLKLAKWKSVICKKKTQNKNLRCAEWKSVICRLSAYILSWKQKSLRYFSKSFEEDQGLCLEECHRSNNNCQRDQDHFIHHFMALFYVVITVRIGQCLLHLLTLIASWIYTFNH